MIKPLIGLVLMFVVLQSFAAEDLYHFQHAQDKKRFTQLTYELRCLVCQNQNLLESQAPLAADLRKEVADKIKSGQSNKDIIQYMVARYGDFVLYKPPLMTTTYLLWFGPFALLILGLGLLLWIVLSYKNTKTPLQLTAEEKAKADELLK